MLNNIEILLKDKKTIRYVFYSFLVFTTYLFLKEVSESPIFIQYFNFHEIVFADKFVHLVIFAMLTFLLGLSYKNIDQNLWFVIFYGIMIEILQETFTDTRSFDVLDIVADIAGIAIGWYFIKIKFIFKILKLKN